MFPMQEPIRWHQLLLFLNDYMKYHDFLLRTIPITADIFVFFYPFLLVIIYIIWLKKNSSYYKESALWIFWSGIFSVAINVFIQFFCSKLRPNIFLWLDYEKTETILHKILPSSSFPSDHSAISMWIALWLLLWWIRNKDKKYIFLWIIFILFALIMWVSRVAITVHWPTDVIAWFIVWIAVPLILFQKNIYKYVQKIFITPLINFQKFLWSKVFCVKY